MSAERLAELFEEQARIAQAIAEELRSAGEVPSPAPSRTQPKRKRRPIIKPRPADPGNVSDVGMQEARKILRGRR